MQLSDHFKKSVELLLASVRLRQQNEGRDSPELHRLAAESEAPWYAMSDEEQSLLNALSADLWALTEKEPLGPAPEPEQVVRLANAKAAERWVEVAELLLACPKLAVGIDGATLRASVWSSFGQRAVAGEFRALAQRLLSQARMRTAAQNIEKRRTAILGTKQERHGPPPLWRKAAA